MSIVSQAFVFATAHYQYQHRNGTKTSYMSHCSMSVRYLQRKIAAIRYWPQPYYMMW